MAYTESDVSVAIARANGQKLDDIMKGNLNGADPGSIGANRNIKVQAGEPYAKKTGHTFAHVATFSQGAIDPAIKASGAKSASDKSTWQDRRTAIAAATELMNSPQAKPYIELFNNPPTPSSPQRVKAVPLDGTYYGYEAGSNDLRQVEFGTVIFFIAAGTLFIYSCYPEGFVAGPKGLYESPVTDLSSIFPN